MFAEYLPIFMFVALGLLLFTGFPVAFILGGVGLAFAFIGMALGEFQFIFLKLLPSRIFGGVMENTQLTHLSAIMFVAVGAYGFVRHRPSETPLRRAAGAVTSVFSILIGLTVYMIVFRFLGGDELTQAFLTARGMDPISAVFFMGHAVNWALIALIGWHAFKVLRADWRAA